MRMILKVLMREVEQDTPTQLHDVMRKNKAHNT